MLNNPEVESQLRHALAASEAALGADHLDVAIALNNLAQLLFNTRRMEEAEPLLRRALAIREADLGAQHPDLAQDLSNLALLLKETRRRDEAELLLRRRLLIFLTFLRDSGQPHPQLHRALRYYAGLCRERKRPHRNFFQRRLDSLRRRLIKPQPDEEIRRHLFALCREAGLAEKKANEILDAALQT